MPVPFANANSRFMTEAALPPFRFGVAILAAGASTRMGRLKQLLPLEGTPLLVRAVEVALASPAKK